MGRALGLRIFAFVVCLTALPTMAWAQSQIAGTAKDESGGVLPGVTVEAASPALIEKSKTAISDSNGRYTIVDLRRPNPLGSGREERQLLG